MAFVRIKITLKLHSLNLLSTLNRDDSIGAFAEEIRKTQIHLL